MTRRRFDRRFNIGDPPPPRYCPNHNDGGQPGCPGCEIYHDFYKAWLDRLTDPRTWDTPPATAGGFKGVRSAHENTPMTTAGSDTEPEKEHTP